MSAPRRDPDETVVDLPWWHWGLFTVVGILGVLGALVGAVIAPSGSLVWASMWSLLAFFLGGTIAAYSLCPRREHPGDPGDGGSVTFGSPPGLVPGLLLAWAGLVVTAALWAAAPLRGEHVDLELVVCTVAGALVTIPNLVRLCLGRLHPWRLTLSPTGLRYRGYRTDVTWGWAEVQGASARPRRPVPLRQALSPGSTPGDERGRPAATVIHLRGNRTHAIQIGSLNHPPHQLAHEIQAARKRWS